jgi:hypothetical protein
MPIDDQDQMVGAVRTTTKVGVEFVNQQIRSPWYRFLAVLGEGGAGVLVAQSEHPILQAAGHGAVMGAVATLDSM